VTEPGTYAVNIRASAEREMASLPKTAFRALSKKILDLESNPRPQRCKKLSGRQEYRVRVGDYRVLYVVDDAAKTVEIVAVGDRKDVYRR
jgi:mRNA interferase RelE/StbE